MATTPRWGIRYPVGTDVPDVPLWMERMALDLDDHAKDLQDVAANRPAAGKRGRFFYATDSGVLYRDNGTEWIALGRLGADAPIGSMLDYGGTGDPSPEWLAADGRAVSRTTYAAAFAVLGTAYGAGDGTTTFNLPNTLGRVMVGAGAGAGLTNRARGASGGAERVTLTANESGVKAHGHGNNISFGVNDPGHRHVVSILQDSNPTANPNSSLGLAPQHDFQTIANPEVSLEGTGITLTKSGGVTNHGGESAGASHENMPPFLVATKIIRVL